MPTDGNLPLCLLVIPWPVEGSPSPLTYGGGGQQEKPVSPGQSPSVEGLEQAPTLSPHTHSQAHAPVGTSVRVKKERILLGLGSMGSGRDTHLSDWMKVEVPGLEYGEHKCLQVTSRSI